LLDVAALSMAMSQASLKQAVSIRVTRMAMDTAKTQAQVMNDMLSASTVAQRSPIDVGRIVDIRA
jgi:hypothetical protein